MVDCRCFSATALEQGPNTSSLLGSDSFGFAYQVFLSLYSIISMGRLFICFSVDRRRCPHFVLLQCFLWIRGTRPSLYCDNISFCVTTALGYIGIITKVFWRRFAMFGHNYFFHRVTVVAAHTFCFFRLFLVTHAWLRPRFEVHTGLYVKPDLEELIPTFLKSKSDSTTKVRLVPPFPATFVVAYIFKACKGSSSFLSLYLWLAWPLSGFIRFA